MKRRFQPDASPLESRRPLSLPPGPAPVGLAEVDPNPVPPDPVPDPGLLIIVPQDNVPLPPGYLPGP